MTDGRPQPTIDELLDEYVTAWHAGEAPSTAAFVERAPEADRDELTQVLATFLELAPTVEPTPARVRALGADSLVQRLAGLEGARWDALDGVERAAEVAHAAAGRAAADATAASATTSWGVRLRALRDAAGLSIDTLGERFAAAFSLTAEESAGAAPALAALEAGELPSTGVAARAARALEEILGAVRGTLAPGAAPAFGGPLLRGGLPESPDERARFAELLREVDDALAMERDAHEGYDETLSDLLGT